MMTSRLARTTLSRTTPNSSRTFFTKGPSGQGYRLSPLTPLTPYAARRQQHFFRSVATVVTLGAVGTAWQWFAHDVHAEAPELSKVKFEEPRASADSAEAYKDILSSQHLQVRKSVENPGVYAWGSNTGKVVAPDSKETVIKTPRRIPYFDGRALRDIKLDRNFGAAIDENGDLLQWGVGYSKDIKAPEPTLKGKDLTSLAISRDRILGLGKDGSVYSIPVSKKDQEQGKKLSESSWIPGLSSTASISYRKLEPQNLAWGEKVISVNSGAEHALLLTSKGRVFSAASASADFPSKGQMGIPGLSWETRPDGPYDQPHEITTLRGFPIIQTATGDYHSVVRDRDGKIFTFGDNSYGQLGFDYTPETASIETPALLPIHTLYAGTGQTARATAIAAGGLNTYFTVDATRTSAPPADRALTRLLGQVTADTWACGQGLWGNLGNGRWTHVQSTPTKVPALSGLYEYDEATNRTVPIRLRALSVGATHAAAVMDNFTHIAAARRAVTADADTSYGADILFFGNNEHFQLGTGRRTNVNNPTYIPPLDADAELAVRPVAPGGDQKRFQITPRTTVHVGGKWRPVEQRVECGRGVTAVYSAVV